MEYILLILHEKSDMNGSHKSEPVSKQNAAKTTKGPRDVTVTPMAFGANDYPALFEFLRPQVPRMSASSRFD
jgi:hypothetical protein